MATQKVGVELAMSKKFLLSVIVLALMVVLTACAQQQAVECPPGVQEAQASAVVNVTAPPLVNASALPAVQNTSAAPAPTPTNISGSVTKRFVEGDVVQFTLAATDPDGDPLTYTFSAPFSTSGAWKTKVGDAGEYTVNITVSDGKTNVSRKVRVVIERYNTAPVLSGLSNMVVSEGQPVMLAPVINDAQGDAVNVTYSGFMNSSSYTTTYLDAGEYQVTVTASDGVLSTSKTINITVKNVNRAPTIVPIANVQAKEGDTITVLPEAQDQDGEQLTFDFSSPLGANGQWVTKVGDKGDYTATVTVSDGVASAKASFRITVLAQNLPPTIAVVQNVTANEGDTVTLSPVVQDPEGKDVSVTYNGFMDTNTKQLSYDDAGTHIVTVTASDGVNSVSANVTITVHDVNRPPQFGEDFFS